MRKHRSREAWGWRAAPKESRLSWVLSDEWRETKRVSWPIGDLWSDLVSNLRCPNPDAMCYGLEIELCWLINLRCGDARSIYWLVLQRCSIDIFVFRFALVIFDLVICSAYWVLIFFFFFFWESVGLLYLFTICWVVFSLDWVCFMFRIDVGLFCGLSLLQFFFSKFQFKNFFGLFFFPWK